jgi:hypothetical protein
MNTTATVAVHRGAVGTSENLWLHNKRWDLTFISLSAVLVILPFAAYELAKYLLGFGSVRAALSVAPEDILDFSRNTVNALIALLIGGPHMYATYTRTWFDTDFRKRHVGFLLGSLILPVVVVYLGVINFPLLVTFFFFWASVHILHQIAYILDCYSMKQSKALSFPNRVLDYVVVFSSLYPIGVWRMVSGDFAIGKIRLLFPEFILIRNNPLLGYGLFFLVTLLFAVALTLWLLRSWREYRAGELHTPKFILMALTIGVSFFIPSYHELDVAFQGFNTWHSFQYLGLTLYINRLRAKKEGINTPLIRGISAEGKGWRFYAWNVGMAASTVVLIAILLVNKQALGFSFDQCYYIVVLSVLLMHYYHDHLLFTDTGIVAGR